MLMYAIMVEMMDIVTIAYSLTRTKEITKRLLARKVV